MPLRVREKMGQCVYEAHLFQLFRDPHARVDSFSALRVLGLVVLQEVAPGQLGTHEPQKRRLVCVLFVCEGKEVTTLDIL